MKFLEKNLEDIIWETKPYLLFERGLEESPRGRVFRQLKIGQYGIADIVSAHKDCDIVPIENSEDWRIIPTLNINIYELKKDALDNSAFFQALNYAKGIERYISNHRQKNLQLSLSIILIGSSINTSDNFCYLPDYLTGFLSLHVYTYKYKFDGIKFIKHNGYKRTEEGFE